MDVPNITDRAKSVNNALIDAFVSNKALEAELNVNMLTGSEALKKVKELQKILRKELKRAKSLQRRFKRLRVWYKTLEETRLLKNIEISKKILNEIGSLKKALEKAVPEVVDAEAVVEVKAVVNLKELRKLRKKAYKIAVENGITLGKVGIKEAENSRDKNIRGRECLRRRNKYVRRRNECVRSNKD